MYINNYISINQIHPLASTKKIFQKPVQHPPLYLPRVLWHSGHLCVTLFSLFFICLLYVISGAWQSRVSLSKLVILWIYNTSGFLTLFLNRQSIFSEFYFCTQAGFNLRLKRFCRALIISVRSTTTLKLGYVCPLVCT